MYELLSQTLNTSYQGISFVTEDKWEPTGSFKLEVTNTNIFKVSVDGGGGGYFVK
jgi:hypothetical protein